MNIGLKRLRNKGAKKYCTDHDGNPIGYTVPTPNAAQSRKLDARIRAHEAMTNKKGRTRPGSRNPRKGA